MTTQYALNGADGKGGIRHISGALRHRGGRGCDESGRLTRARQTLMGNRGETMATKLSEVELIRRMHEKRERLKKAGKLYPRTPAAKEPATPDGSVVPNAGPPLVLR